MKTLIRNIFLRLIEWMLESFKYLPSAPLNERRGNGPFLAHASCGKCGEGWKIFIPHGEPTIANAALMCNDCDDTTGRFD